MRSLKAKAYAKINLFLEITGKRDDGYHLLDTVMQSVGLYDEIELRLTDREGISVICDDNSLCGSDNIVYKTCLSFFEFSGWTSGIEIKINKNIPIAAGMGGGSADAATVLNMLNILSEKNYDADTLCKIARSLGADVPFCVLGGTAKAEGIGDILENIKTPNLYAVLLKEGEKQSTKEMYNQIDALVSQSKRNSVAIIDGILNDANEKIYKNIYNAFEICWNMNDFRNIFEPFSPKAVFLSGSGPTVCALFEDYASAKEVFDSLKSNGFRVFCAPFCSVGSVIE